MGSFDINNFQGDLLSQDIKSTCQSIQDSKIVSMTLDQTTNNSVTLATSSNIQTHNMYILGEKYDEVSA